MFKGLGCPVGTLVAGSHEFMKKVFRCRKALGGSMRQAGVIAASGIVALNSMIDRLDDDHQNARTIAEGKLNFSTVSIFFLMFSQHFSHTFLQK